MQPYGKCRAERATHKRHKPLGFIGGYPENEGSNDEIDENDCFYCAINDKYTPERFTEIAVMLCKKYGQDAVLVTFPVADKPRATRSKQNIIRVDGKYYDKNGKVDKEFDNITVQNVTEYFTKVGNRKLLHSILTSATAF